jgi:hypothetical protein
MRARNYDSSTGRFQSPDPLGAIDSPEASQYGYAKNNPLMYTDPSGMGAVGQSRIDWGEWVAGAFVSTVGVIWIGIGVTATGACYISTVGSGVGDIIDVIHLALCLGPAAAGWGGGGSLVEIGGKVQIGAIAGTK